MRRNKANERKRAKSRDKNLKIKKVEAELRVKDQADVIHGKLVLNDFLPEGASLFVERPLSSGLQVSLSLQEPKSFYIKGEVVECTEVASPYRVISAKALPYRVSIRFTPGSEDEKRAVEQYCASLRGEILGNAAA